MVVLIVVLVGLVALDVAALVWGHDCTDGFHSAEWERRRSGRQRGGA